MIPRRKVLLHLLSRKSATASQLLVRYQNLTQSMRMWMGDSLDQPGIRNPFQGDPTEQQVLFSLSYMTVRGWVYPHKPTYGDFNFLITDKGGAIVATDKELLRALYGLDDEFLMLCRAVAQQRR